MCIPSGTALAHIPQTPTFYRDPPSFFIPLPPSLILRATEVCHPHCPPKTFVILQDSQICLAVGLHPASLYLWGFAASPPPCSSSLRTARPPPQVCAARRGIPSARPWESLVLLPQVVARAGSPGDPHRSRVLLCATDPRAGGAASRLRCIGAAPRALPRAAPGSGKKEAARGGGRHRTQSLIPRSRRRLRHCCAREQATRSLRARLEHRATGTGRGVSAGGERGEPPSISHAEGCGRRAGGQRRRTGYASRKARHGWRPLARS